MNSDHSLPQVPKGKTRTGCFGCFWQTVVVLVLGGILVIAGMGIFYPWAFYLGGKFHILPYWSGLGTAHARSGAYLVWIQIQPTPRNSKMFLETNLRGIAYVCTPRGESIRMKLGGGMRKHLNLSTDGEAIHLYMNYSPWNRQFITDRRPRLEFRGIWRNPNLAMDDHGSIERAFQSDGTVYRGPEANRPYDTEAVPITFAQKSYGEFKRACSAGPR
jgi:hypothetical protein